MYVFEEQNNKEGEQKREREREREGESHLHPLVNSPNGLSWVLLTPEAKISILDTHTALREPGYMKVYQKDSD